LFFFDEIGICLVALLKKKGFANFKKGPVKLKRIELKGFKSFCDRTEIRFDQDITGIVGPNGCGKSNIVDAIRWVMGEQSAKHLRGKNMEDVIFAGSKDRDPSSMASVEITFTSPDTGLPPPYTQFSEISIGRKLYRDGTSEYTVNKDVVRLKDVTDFFLGTGVGTKAYSIIEQGRVGQIVTAKPEERRHFIEEAAGISKFQIRKQAAQRKMEATQQNLLRLVDIVTEIERQKNSLEKQAKKAEKYKIVRDELKQLDLKVSAIDHQKLTTRQKNHLEILKTLDQQQVEIEALINQEELAYEESRLALTEVETLVADSQQKVYEWNNLHQLSESHLANRRDVVQRLSAQILQSLQNIENLASQLENIIAQREVAITQSVAADLETEALTAEVDALTGEFADWQQKTRVLFDEVNAVREQKNQAERRVVEITSQQEAQQNSLAEKQSRHATFTNELGELTEKYTRLKRLLDNTREDLASVKQLKFSLSEQSEKLSEEFASVESRVKSEQGELEAIKEALLQKKSRLQSLEELERNFEGYLDGPRSLLQKRSAGELDAILGSVADFIETDPQYMDAVSAVLGEKAQTLVVSTQTDGVTCAESLRTLASGRGSFVALNASADFGSARQREVVPASGDRVPVLGMVSDFVRTKPGYESLKNVLFNDTLLVETLAQALECWQTQKQPVATLQGELIAREGILIGGSPEKTSSALLEKKQEIKTLKQIVNDLMTEVKGKEELCFDLQRKLKTLKAELDVMRSSCHEEDIKITRQEQDMHHCQQEIESLDRARQKLASELNDLESDIESSHEKMTQWTLEKSTQSETFERCTSILQSKQSEEEEAKAVLLQKQDWLTQKKVELAEKRQQKTSLEKEVARLFDECLRVRQSLGEAQDDWHLQTRLKLFWESRLAFCEKNITRILKNKNQVEADYRVQKDDFETKNQIVREQENQLHTHHRDLSKLKDNINRESMALTEIRAHLSRLSEQMLERHQVILSDVAQEICNQVSAESFDYSEAVGRAQDLREQLSRAGSVNLAAIDELEEINQRYEFLAAQKADLEQSLGSLEKAIHKINQTTKVRFQETFELVNQKFQQVFPKLFRGGEAHLKLTDPDNILETGVDVIAQPPGKRLQSISLLSGGEKALTAVSLLFSIFLIKPSPFCLLDEVDAPLDDVNVDRYNEIVKDMAQNTQFIVVTHNKRTMQITDALFGVTMEQAGVSQMVSVNIS